METDTTLYACRFTEAGDVFLADGSSSEEWGTGGHTSDDYAVAMAEVDDSGYYHARFDAEGNISDGLYNVVIYKQVGLYPKDADPSVGQGEIDWRDGEEFTKGVLHADLKQRTGPWI